MRSTWKNKMNTDIPYLPAVGNLPKVLEKIQQAGAPETFTLEFLKDMGFASSQDRPTPKLLKYLGLLDGNGHPTAAYKEFMDHTRARRVLAGRLRIAFDDLFKADRKANEKTAEELKGWFKTKTGAGDAVAKKIATTFKTLASYADFSGPDVEVPSEESEDDQKREADGRHASHPQSRNAGAKGGSIGLVYRFEIHLPDTQNVDTFRAIFRALREELM
jgi:hypothetical protein